MSLDPAVFIQGASYSAVDVRQALSALGGLRLPATLSGANSGPSGVVGTADLAVTPNGTPNMSVNVAAGQVWMPGTQVANQGLYYGFNPSTVNLSIAASDPTNPRYDAVVASVNDAEYAGTNNDWVLQVITGTPAASPSYPTAPDNSVLLAIVSVAANATSITSGDITDWRPTAFVPAVYDAGLVGQAVSPSTTVTLAPTTPGADTVSGNDTTDKGYKVPTGYDGYWTVDAQVSAYSSNTANWHASIQINGTAVRRSYSAWSGAGTSADEQTLSLHWRGHLNVGDIVTVVFSNDSSGTTVQVDTDSTRSALSLNRIGS